jgi:integrase
MPKLTKKFIDALEFTDSGQPVFWDDALPGFGVRVNATCKTFIVTRRVNGRLKKAVIGRYGVYTVDAARDEARQILLDMTHGTDPTEEKERKKKALVTLADVAETYLRDRPLKPASIKDIQKHLHTTFADWQKMPVAKITRQMVLTRFRQASEKGPAQANLAFRNLRALLNFAKAFYRIEGDESLLKENPVNVLSDARIWHNIKPKSRKIPLEKIGQAYNFLIQEREAPGRTPDAGSLASALVFMMLTGCRRLEAFSLKWCAVDFKKRTWRIADPKNNRPITLPLSSQALELLASLPRPGKYVFHSEAAKAGFVNSPQKITRRLSECIDTTVSCHDMRRSFVSVAAACNIEFVRVKLLLNHRTGDDVTLHHYSETDNLSWLEPEIQRIGDYIERAAMLAQNKVIDLDMRRANEKQN